MSDPNSVDDVTCLDDRARRRVTNAVRKAMQEYEIAYELALITDESKDSEHADDLRKILLAEIEEARLSLPPSVSQSVPTPLEESLAKASEVLSKLRVLVPSPNGNEHSRHQDSETDRGHGGGDCPAASSSSKRVRRDGDEQMNGPNDDELLIDLVSVSRQNSNHSGLSNVSLGSHVEMTRSQIAREREIFDCHQRIQELEDELKSERRKRDDEVATMKGRWDREMDKCKMNLKERYANEIAELKDTIVDQDRRIVLLQQNRPIPTPPAPLPPVLTYREVESEYTPEELDRRLRLLEHGQMIRMSSNASDRPDSDSTVPKTPVPQSVPRIPITMTHTTAATTSRMTTSVAQPVSVSFVNVPTTTSGHTASFSTIALPNNNATNAPPGNNPDISSSRIQGAPTIDATSQSLVDIQLKSHAFSVLIQRRPKYRYTGENKRVDFESFLHSFLTMTNVPGADDPMKLAELGHWFDGQAALVTERYLTEANATEALKSAVKALKSEFGKKKLTAKQMLQELLSGDKLLERDHHHVKTFLLRLEKTYKVAQETKRDQSFDLPEVINDVIRNKLPHLAQKWAKKISDQEMDDNEEDAPLPTFSQFLAFAKRQNNVAQTLGDILKPTESSKPQQRPAVRIAANNQSAPGPSSSAARPSSASSSTPLRTSVCPFCPGASHSATSCRKFAGFSFADKAKFVHDNRICIRCLGRGHTATHCISTNTCQKCGGSHADLMHGVKLKPALSS